MFYAFLWLLHGGEIPAFVEAVSVRTGERYRTVPSSGDMQRVALELGDMVDTIRMAWASRQDLVRTGGPWCHFCPILTDCEEGQSAEALLD
jgi:hypothetical protein